LDDRLGCGRRRNVRSTQKGPASTRILVVPEVKDEKLDTFQKYLVEEFNDDYLEGLYLSKQGISPE
jgi:hypothetical protein